MRALVGLEGVDLLNSMTRGRVVVCAAICTTLLGLPGALEVADAAAPRGYEKVSPEAKNAYDMQPRGSHTVSPDGNRVTYLSYVTAPDASNGSSTPLMGRRTANGWLSRAVDASGANEIELLSDDLSRSVVLAGYTLSDDGTANPKENVRNLYVRNNETNTFSLLTPVPSPAGAQPRVAGASTNWNAIFYEQDGTPQTSTPTTGQYNTYKWIDGATRLVGVLPDGSVPPGGTRPGSSLQGGSVERTQSLDGLRSVFHVVDLAAESNPPASSGGQLFSRYDDGTASSTTPISASVRTVPDPVGSLPALYWTAEAEHGSKVLFTSCEKLTDDSNASTTVGVESNAACFDASSLHVTTQNLVGRDLYLYDFALNGGAGGLVDLTTADPNGGRVYGVVGASDDLNRIYFVAGGVLVPGSAAVPDAPNLYLLDHGQMRYIATLQGQMPDPVGSRPPHDTDNWAVRRPDKAQETRTSADGLHMLFTSRAQLTSYDNVNPAACPPVVNGSDVFNADGRCMEVYRYDAEADDIMCVSCNPDGSPPKGDAALFRGDSGVAGFNANALPANLTPDGGTVFFESHDALVLGDSNGLKDVYEWLDGAVSLVSSGKSVEDSDFTDATPSGSDVIFTTRERLVASDRDDIVDVYDARVGGGFPDPPVVQPCVSDGCHGPQSAPPSLVDPGSATFAGPGDPTPATTKRRVCGKGQTKVKVGGRTRCLKACRKGTVRRKVKGKLRCVDRSRRAATRRAQRHTTQGRRR